MLYGKEFKKACRYLGIKGKTLHSLRHTYAVRRWAITGDIKMVSQEIGHSSVVMTEKYGFSKVRRLMYNEYKIKDFNSYFLYSKSDCNPYKYNSLS